MFEYDLQLTIISASGTVAISTLLSWRLWMSLTVPRLWAKSPSTEPRCSSPTVTSNDITGSRTWPPPSLKACVEQWQKCKWSFFFLICSQISSKNVNSFFPLFKACITNPNYACALAEHADVYFYFDFFVRFVWRSLLFGWAQRKRHFTAV